MQPTVIRHHTTTTGALLVVTHTGRNGRFTAYFQALSVGVEGRTVYDSEQAFSTEQGAIAYFNAQVEESLSTQHGA